MDYNNMDNVMAELRQIAVDANIQIILPKAPLLTEQQQAEEDAYFADPNRFVDYIGRIR